MAMLNNQMVYAFIAGRSTHGMQIYVILTVMTSPYHSIIFHPASTLVQSMSRVKLGR
jgi:hypothetical protein